MKLTDYLLANHLSDAEFAALVGVNRSTVGRWMDRNNPTSPRDRHLARIFEVTGGQVTAIDFVVARMAAGDDAEESEIGSQKTKSTAEEEPVRIRIS